MCQTFCWAWGGAGSSGKLAAGPPGPWGVSSPSCRTEVLEVKAHVSFGRRIRGGLHSSSHLGHRHITEPWHVPSCGVPAEGDQHTLAERVRLALVLPGSSRRTFSFSVAGAAARPAGGRLPDSCLLAAPRVSQSPSLPSALLGVGTRLSPWSSCLSVSPHGHVLTSRAGRRSAPRLTPAHPRTAPVLLGAAFPGLRHRHRPHVRASRFALAVFLIATEYRRVEAAAPQFGAFRQVSGLETPVLPRGLYGGGGGRAPGHGPCRFHTSAGRLTASHSTRACCVAGREGGSGVLWGAPLCSLPCSEVTELPDQSSVSLQNSFELFGPVHLKTIKDFP